jgi:hypothetical protein
MHMASAPLERGTPAPAPNAPNGALTTDLVHFFAEAGVMKSVLDAERLALQKSFAP